nr:hypothetical protein [Tanacetum cinerariifolium]
ALVLSAARRRYSGVAADASNQQPLVFGRLLRATCRAQCSTASATITRRRALSLPDAKTSATLCASPRYPAWLGPDA